MYRLNLDPEVMRYTGDQPFDSEDDAAQFIESYDAYSRWGYGRWAVCSKEDRKFVGWCGLKYDTMYKAPDLGFRIFREQWGRGIATEVAQACVDYGFDELGLQRIIGRAYVENKASVRVLEKCNFTYLGKVKHDGRDALLYHIENDRDKGD
jgi:RimJ/RimL family protein N-acetyltransferase